MISSNIINHSLGKKTKEENTCFELDGIKIHVQPENELKLLGVTTAFKLNFSYHVSNICKKASQKLNILKRIGVYLKASGKIIVYHTFLMSNFN